jgi:hypothetical protein
MITYLWMWRVKLGTETGHKHDLHSLDTILCASPQVTIVTTMRHFEGVHVQNM